MLFEEYPNCPFNVFQWHLIQDTLLALEVAQQDKHAVLFKSGLISTVIELLKQSITLPFLKAVTCIFKYKAYVCSADKRLLDPVRSY